MRGPDGLLFSLKTESTGTLCNSAIVSSLHDELLSLGSDDLAAIDTLGRYLETRLAAVEKCGSVSFPSSGSGPLVLTRPVSRDDIDVRSASDASRYGSPLFVAVAKSLLWLYGYEGRIDTVENAQFRQNYRRAMQEDYRNFDGLDLMAMFNAVQPSIGGEVEVIYPDGSKQEIGYLFIRGGRSLTIATQSTPEEGKVKLALSEGVPIDRRAEGFLNVLDATKGGTVDFIDFSVRGSAVSEVERTRLTNRDGAYAGLTSEF